MLSQWCHNGVTMVSQWCHNGVTRYNVFHYAVTIVLFSVVHTKDDQSASPFNPDPDNDETKASEQV